MDRDTKLRLNLFRAAIVVVFLFLLVQLWRLQIVQGAYFKELANHNRYRLVPIDAPRGVIYDRKGNILVRNTPTYSVLIVPADLPEDEQAEEAIYARLSALLDVPVSSEDEEVTSAREKAPYFLIRKDAQWSPAPQHVPYIPRPGIKELVAKTRLLAPFTPIVIATKVDRDTAFIIEEEHLELPGVQIKAEPIRQYLFGELTSHVIGYVGPIPEEWADDYPRPEYSPDDTVGLSGVEYTFEKELHGIKGRKHIEVDVAGREIKTIGQSYPAQPGHNLVLTIDLDLQKVVDSALKKALKKSGSESGVAIVMNVNTGEILAMVSLPSYDNNLFAAGISVRDYARLSSAPARPLINHAISGLYPPGSTFKIIPASAALEEGVIDRHQTIRCEGTMWVPNKYFPDDPKLAQPFYCWYKPGHGLVNMISGLAESCDIYFYTLGGGFGDFEGLGWQRLADYSQWFGMGQLTGIDLPGENPGLIPTAKWKRLTKAEIWVLGDTYHMAIGQGDVLATPLQMLNATAAVANGGTLYRPQLARMVTDAEGHIIRTFEPQVLQHVPVSDENLAIVREGMRAAVTWGTSWATNLPQVAVAGKTGTAEYPGPRDRRGRLPTHAWFTAFAPYENPEIAVVVFVDNGGEGSETAVPVAAEILNYYFPVTEEPQPGTTPGAPTGPGPAPTPTPAPAAPPRPAPVPAQLTKSPFEAKLLGVEDYLAQVAAVTGQVVGRNNEPLAGRPVAVVEAGRLIYQGFTGPDGGFQFEQSSPAVDARWDVILVGHLNAQKVSLQIESGKKYIVQFHQTGW